VILRYDEVGRMNLLIRCGCGQWAAHPDAQSCLELQYDDEGRVPSGFYDGVIEVGNPDLVVWGYPGEGDACDCPCHEDGR
jgi:hypothetical protein